MQSQGGSLFIAKWCKYSLPFTPENIEEEAGTLAKAGIEQINRLFALEKEFESLDENERKNQRLLQEKPVLEAFWAW